MRSAAAVFARVVKYRLKKRNGRGWYMEKESQLWFVFNGTPRRMTSFWTSLDRRSVQKLVILLGVDLRIITECGVMIVVQISQV